MQKITIKSEDFKYGENIPAEYTCDGKNISPGLFWNGIPVGTKSIALIMDDPDAPKGTFVHWILFNLPANVDKLPRSIIPRGSFLKNEGMTDFGRTGYGGPCPPSGIHRYYFRLYALDILLNLESGATRKQVDNSMIGHILASGELLGLYKRQR